MLRAQRRRQCAVCFDYGVGHPARVEDILAAQRLHQVGGGQPQHPQSVLVDLSVQNDRFGTPGEKIEELLAAETHHRPQQLQCRNEEQRDEAGGDGDILRFNGDGRQIRDQDGGYQLLRLQLSQLTLAHQPHGKQNAEIQNNSAAKQQFHAQTLHGGVRGVFRCGKAGILHTQRSDGCAAAFAKPYGKPVRA